MKYVKLRRQPHEMPALEDTALQGGEIERPYQVPARQVRGHEVMQ